MEIDVELTADEILSVISELDIFKFYCTNFKEIDKPFSSEFREDPKPSCRISNRDGFFLYKDFGETSSHNCWGYVMRKFSCNYKTALSIVSNDFNLSHKYTKFVTKSFNVNKKIPIKKDKKSKDTIIKVKRREWLNIDKEFWYDKYCIKFETLDKFNVAPITNFWIDNYRYDCDVSQVYCYYYYKDTVHRFKIYNPYSDKFNKWYSNVNGTIIQGINMLPKSGDKLIISKSLKDVICLYEMGFNAIAGNNETSFIPEVNINKFKNRFKEIYLYFDNDEAGIKYGKMFAGKYRFKAIFNPMGECKDISDVIHYNGIEYAKNLLKQLINGYNKVHK